MIYDGKKASLFIQSQLQERVQALSCPPKLAVLSIATHPSIVSFIKIKRRFAEAIGIIMEEYDFDESVNESELIQKIKELSKTNEYAGIVVQLPLPKTFNTQSVLDALPEDLDVDVLSSFAWKTFMTTQKPIPPVAEAIAYILHDTHTNLAHKKVVIIGQGKLVGLPVTAWFTHQGITPEIITIDTDEITRLKLYKEGDIVISGIGIPHHLKPEYFKEGVILIDAGTSEQSGVLAGDCDPRCADSASVFTPVPGGVGPLTVAFLFYNVVTSAEQKIKKFMN